MSIRRDSRKCLSRILQDFISGKITNREMIDLFDRVPEGDSGVEEIARKMEFFYDDSLRIVRLEGGTGGDEQDLEIVLRCLSFLEGNQEFQKPTHSILLEARELVRGALHSLTFGILGERIRSFDERYEFWPYTKEQLEMIESNVCCLGESDDDGTE